LGQFDVEVSDPELASAGQVWVVVPVDEPLSVEVLPEAAALAVGLGLAANTLAAPTEVRAPATSTAARAVRSRFGLRTGIGVGRTSVSLVGSIIDFLSCYMVQENHACQTEVSG